MMNRFSVARGSMFSAAAVALFLAGAFLPAPADRSDWPLAGTAPLSDPAYEQINDSARGLAGEAPRGEANWQNNADWKNYQDWIASRWSYIGRVRLNAMKAWGDSELGSLRDRCQTVYYPFSGPDFLYVNALFPDSKYLLMAGLEPVGSMPDFNELQREGRLGPYLSQVKTSLFTILAASFFKTKDMKTDFDNGLVNGLVPAIVVFLAREGYSIDSLTYVSLGHDGELHARSGPGGNGVQITYFRGDRSDARVLLYFQTDLGNDGVHDNPGFVRLMDRLKPGVTYLKAASYLLYEDYFSGIRDAILEDSIGVVEDDSGIPLKDFKPSQWDVTPYGNYTGPIGLFKDKYQPDVMALYKSKSHSALSFGSGYKYIAANSSLLVARKK
jgi:hypothetical protein